MNLEEILTQHRDRIIREWIRLLHLGVSRRYSERPLDELFITVSRAYDASRDVLLHDDYSSIDAHIEWIAKIRLEGGFFLSDVQNAYELCRTILVPLLVTNLADEALLSALQRLDACLLYTIKRFSNYYQTLHEKDIREHAENLEQEVEKRTRELLETEKRIRESERLAHIGKLTASLAHEIRNPLSSVKMNSQIILKNTRFSGNDRRRLEIIVQEISRLERILDEMLDFAKPVKLNVGFVSVNAILDSCLEIMEARIKEKGVKVRKRYARKMSETWADPEKMEQAIINVLLNAVEAVPEGGHLEVTTKQLKADGQALRVEISDDGPGIAPEDLPFIFNPFFSNKKKGTGLGLFNVKKIIEAHGGKEKVELRWPKGTRVIFTLPMGEPS